MGNARAADAVGEILVRQGVTHVFMVTGGGAMHLNDALGRQPGLKKIFCHHEQACAMAAESYGRMSGRPAAVNVTTGPGGINALNGVFGAYVDSVPMIVVSGQVKRETLARNYPIPLRQLGDQEVDIVSMVRSITKYATVLQDVGEVRRTVERAIAIAKRGRPGPVWIDMPGDVQGAVIDWEKQSPYDPAEDVPGKDDLNRNSVAELGALTGAALAAAVDKLLGEIARAQRPVVLAGAGVRLSGCHAAFLEAIDRLGIPVTTGWNAHDVLPNANPQYAGRPGTIGDRPGNFAVQNADFVLVLGSRLNIRQVSYNWKAFARNARVAMVDVDGAELAKPTLHIDLPIHANLRDFFAVLGPKLSSWTPPTPHRAYLAWCRERVKRYPVVLPEYWEKASPINPYCFGQVLFEELQEGDLVVTGDGTACVTIFQSAAVKTGQRLYTNSGCASMGYDLPAAIGAWHATGAKRIICLAGDGSVMLNLQELQTIAGGNLPIKVFILNNDGYHSIRQTQQNYFPDNVVGCGPDSGLTFPSFERLAAGFGIAAARVATHAGLKEAIRAALVSEGPYLLEVMLDKAQQFAPKLASRRLADGTMVSPPLEDMAPFLSREELAENTPWASAKDGR
jgi:acetolactate synthase-1/2/3 large subunit